MSTIFGRSRPSTRLLMLTGIGILALLLLLLGWRVGPGLTFTMAMRRPESPNGSAGFTVEEHAAIAGERRIPIRIYRPSRAPRQAVLLAHGVHADGYNEARLGRFARELARRGYLVAVPDLEDLKSYDLAPRAVDDLEASMHYLLEAPGLQAAKMARRPVLYGISFSGGLGICAAVRPSLQGQVGAIFSFGGHGDLERVMHYLSTGIMPNGGVLAPHLYGQAVLMRRLADRLVPQDQVEALRSALFLFLKEQPEAFQAAVPKLPPESRKLAELCLHWDAKGMGDVLRPFAEQLRCDPALSPMRGPVPDCPVFLLHGSVDNVIPPSETEALAAWASQRTETRALVTDLIRHVELEDKGERKPALLESYRLMRFMTALLRA